MKVNYKQIIGSSLLGLGLTLATGVNNQATAFQFGSSYINVNQSDVGNTFKVSWLADQAVDYTGEAYFLIDKFTKNTESNTLTNTSGPTQLNGSSYSVGTTTTTTTSGSTTTVTETTISYNSKKNKYYRTVKTTTSTANVYDKLSLSLLVKNTTKLTQSNENAAILNFAFDVNDPVNFNNDIFRDPKKVNVYTKIGTQPIQLTNSNSLFNYSELNNNFIEKNLDWQSALEANAAGGSNGIDVCLYPANNCSGGTINSGLHAANSATNTKGQLDLFKIDIIGNFNEDDPNNLSLQLENFIMKFQTNTGSYEVAGKQPIDVPDDQNPLLEIPEPSTTAALGIFVLGGLGFLGKKKAR